MVDIHHSFVWSSCTLFIVHSFVDGHQIKYFYPLLVLKVFYKTVSLACIAKFKFCHGFSFECL